MLVHTLNPTILSLGFIQIRWYSISYIVGIAAVYLLLKHLVKRRRLKLSSQEVLDFIVYCSLGLLVGARIGYFLFYDFSALFSDPLELFRLWHGGMSFHGGLIGTFIAGYWFCRRKRLDFLLMADLTVIPVGIALASGRIGNFINGELYGRLWDGVFCIDYTHNPHIQNAPSGCRYPSQLAEVAKNLVIFGIMWTLKDRKWPRGSFFALFLVVYGILRFSIEFIREPDPQIGLFLGIFSMGQVLCAIMILVGGTMLAVLNVRKAK